MLASFGIVDPIKQPDKVLGCFAALSAKHPDLVMAFVGPISTDLADSLARRGDELGLDGRLYITGRVEAALYLDWLTRADLAVQLRASFSGEASAAVGDCLSCGVPTIVTDIGWMGELPDEVALKVPVGRHVERSRGALREAPRRSSGTRQPRRPGTSLRRRPQFQGRCTLTSRRARRDLGRGRMTSTVGDHPSWEHSV